MTGNDESFVKLHPYGGEKEEQSRGEKGGGGGVFGGGGGEERASSRIEDWSWESQNLTVARAPERDGASPRSFAS